MWGKRQDPGNIQEHLLCARACVGDGVCFVLNPSLPASSDPYSQGCAEDEVNEGRA